MKSNRKYYLILAFLFALAVIVEYNAPKPIDWSENYSNNSKNPYGCFILKDLLPNLFPQQEIKETKIPFYNTVDNHVNTNYIIINNIFEPDEYDTEEIFDYVKSGNQLFLAARIIEGPFADSLKITTEGSYFYDTKGTPRVYINFENPTLQQPEDYKFGKNFFYHYFTSFDTSNVVVLGKSNNDETINFIRIKIGKGNIYINTLPYAFSNYFLTDTLNYSYAINALSYLPNQPIIWDEYYKAAKKKADTPLRFILTEPALKFAYFLLIFSLIIYIIFNTKRKQRIIPVIEPLKNSTTDFVSVISSMYYQNKNDLDLAHKKITYFLEMVRTNYLLSTENLDDSFINHLSLKSGVEINITTQLIKKMNAIQHTNTLFSETDLVSLNELITQFNQSKIR